MLSALAAFLEMVANYAAARSGDHAGALRLIRFGAAAAKAGDAYKQAIEIATSKVKVLVEENRGLTGAENAELDASIDANFDRIAAADLSEQGGAGGTDPT